MCATRGGYRLNRLLRIRALIWMISNVTLLPGSITYRKYLERSAGLEDVLECDRCGGRMRILSAILSPDTASKILDCLGLPSRAPLVKPAVRPIEAPELF